MFRVCEAALMIALLWLGQGTADGQQPANAPARNGIKGSAHPELIPDREAIAMFFIHISDGPAALPWQARVNLLAPSGLTAEQVAAVINAANVYRAKANAVAAKVKKVKASRLNGALSSNDKTQIDNLMKQQQSELDSVIQNLADEIGREPNERFRSFIEKHFKPTMVYYPPDAK
jgi:hypothetical protein